VFEDDDSGRSYEVALEAVSLLEHLLDLLIVLGIVGRHAEHGLHDVGVEELTDRLDHLHARGLERLPDTLVACIGGGSNAMGLFYPFLDDKAVRMVGVEAAGHGVETGEHAASLTGGRPGVLHGNRTYLLQDEGDSYRFSNSDPVTGQAAWFDLRVRVERAADHEQGEMEPQFEPTQRPPNLAPAPSILRYGENFRRSRDRAKERAK
jgi:hypothetical protein